MKKALVVLSLFALASLFSSSMAGGGSQMDRIGKIDCQDPKFRPVWEKAMRRYPLPAGAQEMQFVTSFPDEKLADKDIYIGTAMGLARTADGRICVLDQKLKQVVQFDASGAYMRKFGRKGQGPGEFNIPVAICAAGNSIYVVDNGNRNIQRFGTDGELQESGRTAYSYTDIAAGSDGRLYAVALTFMKRNGLVDVLDRDGNFLRTIAEPKNVPSVYAGLMQAVDIAVNDQNEIFLACQFFPYVMKFDQDGNWLGGWIIDNAMLAEDADWNLRYLAEHKGKPGPQPGGPIIDGFAASAGGGFYLLRNFPRTEILEFGGQGRLMQVHWCLPACNYRGRDLAIDPATGLSYTIQWMPDDRIDVFRMKKSEVSAAANRICPSFAL